MSERVTYVVVDIGCIECGEESRVVGLFDSEDAAESAATAYEEAEPQGRWGRAEWRGQHGVEVFAVGASPVEEGAQP